MRDLLIINLCLLPLLLMGQLTQAQWYFGNGSAVNFGTNPPSVPAASSMSTNLGSASVADAAGNLLFYTNGSTVWNQSHGIMANGSGLLGYGFNNALIIKKPGSATEYFLFTNRVIFGNGLYYSVINMGLAAGQGSVTAKNQTITTLAFEDKLNGTIHCNGLDYWIVVKLLGTTQVTFHSYLLTSAGISTVPVISNFAVPPPASGVQSQMKFSPNGRRLFCGNNTDTSPGSTAVFELYDFDPATGLVSNRIPLLTPPATSGNAVGSGTEFSPDGSKIYGSLYQSIPNSESAVIQWNLCAGTSSTAIIASSFVVVQGGYPSLQLAINGKIYFAFPNNTQGWLGIINNPNVAGTGCNVSFAGVPAPLNGVLASALPNFIKSISKPLLAPFTYTANNSLGCQVAQFNFSVAPVGNTSCTAAGYSVVGYSWDFGDPQSGTSNFSNLQNPIHQFSSQGNFTTQLVVQYSCGGGTDTIKQVVQINAPCISITNNSVSCSSLFSATVAPTGILGPYTYTWLPSTSSGSIVSGLAPGTHTVVFSNLASTFTSSQTFTFSPIVPFSGSITVSSSITCNGAYSGTGQVSNLSAGSGTQTYLWTNGTQTTTIASPNNLGAGSWTVTVTDALTACQVTSVHTISQPPPLSPTLTISTPSICAGASAILTANNSGGTPAYTYTFINGPISFSSTITESLVGTHVYTVQSTDANNCLSSATVALNVITNPNLLVPTVSICPTAIALFTASGATSYTWLPPAAASSLSAIAPSTVTLINFTDTPLSNTQYTIIGSNLGCTSSTTTSVFIYPSPTPIINSNSPKCEGSNAVISVSGGTAAVWSGPNSFASNNLNNTITAIGLPNAGVYSTTITSAVGCTATTNSTFVVNPTPTVSAAGSTVCTTQTMSLFANSLPGSSYQWFGLNNFNSVAQNPTLANPTLNRTGSYTVLVTAPTSCTNTAIAQVSVTSPPSLAIALSSNSLCAQAFNGSPNTITLTPSGANSYTLYTPNLLGSSTPVTPSTSLFSTPPFSSSLAAGVATLQGSNGVCTSTASFVFTVVPNPTVGVNSYTPIICAGQNFTYTSNGASSYVWSASTPNYTTWNNGGIAVAHPSINAVFSVYGASLGCNSALQTSSITVYPLPTITLSAKSSSICLYDKTDISVSGTGTSFQWLPMTGLNAYTGSLVNCATQVNQVYTVIATANNCTAAATSSLHVWALPVPSITNLNSKVCLKDNIVLTGNGGVNFDWKGPDKLTVSGQTIIMQAVSPAMAGTYTLVVSDENNCKNSTTTLVDILPLPDGSLVNFKDEFCVPYCATYNFAGSNSNNIQSTWLINGTSFASNAFKYCFKEAGTFTLSGKLVDNTTSCKSSLQYIITTHEKPFADFNFLPKDPIENLDEVQFTNLSEGTGFLSYHWYFNDNKGFSTPTKNTSYLYSEPGDYRIALVTKNNWGCADTVLKKISVAPDFALYVPNSFTPNDDNRNDVFFASARSAKLFDLKIYDRWGAEIFHAKSPSDGWDGTFKGEGCKQDAYTWVIELSTVGGERVVKTGTVLLLR